MTGKLQLQSKLHLQQCAIISACNNVVTYYIYCLDPELKKTIPDSEQNVGETCFASVPFVCNPSYEYRELNGGCTCLEVPSRGMAGSTLTRLLQADYQGTIIVCFKSTIGIITMISDRAKTGRKDAVVENHFETSRRNSGISKQSIWFFPDLIQIYTTK